MSSELNSIAQELESAEIKFLIKGGQIQIALPNGFDTLIIEIWNEDGEDSISLLNGRFHTHGHIEASEHDLPSREKGIRYLVESIFNGTFKMVKVETEPGIYENTIWDTYALEIVDEDDKFIVVGEI
ncbi:hypothetical protein L2725_10955 [Shewanella corallii]|uniref:Uncharacterized protein n=1 Tax=Shewanella corallii TaxID=560080 RepID=A0ABT0N768_9GAMM|nr:hypothetical protein [Shewanella corallii]MCL2914286.1 hypothetical protein [Shewanella corallii]